jgi:peptidoglycan hydrolase-like protein with peptidoglycan-binding domain
MWRALHAGVVGPDVLELQANLVALGLLPAGTTPSGTFDSATRVAVLGWQRHLGEAGTGEVDLGAVAVASDAVRVLATHVDLGAPVAIGDDVLDIASVRRIVAINLDAASAASVQPGDAVSITGPDLTTTATATISAIGAVPSATNPSDPTAPLTVPVSVALPSNSPLGRFEGAPVSVSIVDATHTAVLAAPVTALLATADGGEAVATTGSGSTRTLVPVTTGLFDETTGLIEVSGQLTAGERVEVPAP